MRLLRTQANFFYKENYTIPSAQWYHYSFKIYQEFRKLSIGIRELYKFYKLAGQHETAQPT